MLALTCLPRSNLSCLLFFFFSAQQECHYIVASCTRAFPGPTHGGQPAFHGMDTQNGMIVDDGIFVIDKDKSLSQGLICVTVTVKLLWSGQPPES